MYNIPVLGTTSARNSISIRPFGEPPIFMSKNTTGFSELMVLIAKFLAVTLEVRSRSILKYKLLIQECNDDQSSIVNCHLATWGLILGLSQTCFLQQLAVPCRAVPCHV